ncbi:MAG: hypothetical protein QF570_08470, partial [Myxococcota bacterium]|nr:hypothetical protein [Myxococcota bacterium]
ERTSQQTSELETEREAHRRARERATERETTVSKLHETLASIGRAASVFPLTEIMSSEAGAATESTAVTSADEGADSVSEARDGAPLSADPPEVQQAAPTVEAEAETNAVVEEDAAIEVRSAVEPRKPADTEALLAFVAPSPGAEPPPIFRRWRDQQVARKLAPLDIMNTDAFFVRHIEAAVNLPASDMLEVLSLGGDDRDFEFRIARMLRKQGHTGFRIHFPQRDPEHADQCLRKAAGAGIDQELAPFDTSVWTEAALPDHFHVIVGDGALARSAQVEPVVDALEQAARNGSQVALADRIGHGGSRTANEMGERIWRLMPERYKHNHLSDQIDAEYATSPEPHHTADVLALLRGRFAFEDFASFGHLVDRFIGPEIGPNFDPEDERDRRFIEQIANLDEAKLDSGALQPLQMVSRLAPREDEDA